MPRSMILAVMALVVTSCTSSTPPPESSRTTVPSTAATTTASTTTTTPTTSTTTPASTTRPVATTTVFTPDPLTAGEISAAQLLLMTLDLAALGDEYQGFEEVAIAAEPNLVLARRTLQDPSDEADDIARWGRIGGARAELRPRSIRVGASDVTSIQSWVSLFETDVGAAAYLDDFVQDAAKGIGGGVPDDLVITGADSFALDDLGSQAVGLILVEDVGEGFERYQTVVGLRVGRVLGWVAIVHQTQTDRRVRAIGLAELLADRIVAVLGGELVPPEPPPVLEPLEAYAFEYRQTVDKESSIASITATGVELVGEGIDCRVRFDLEGLVTERVYNIIGDDVLVTDENAPDPKPERTTRETFNTAADLIYCPGWPVELLASGLDVILAGRPITEVTVDGEPGLFYQLGEEEAAEIGFVPESSGIEVDRFEIVIDAVNPWTRSLSIELSGSANAFAEAFGDEFAEFAGNTIIIMIDFVATDINGADLELSRG